MFWRSVQAHTHTVLNRFSSRECEWLCGMVVNEFLWHQEEMSGFIWWSMDLCGVI